MNEYKLTILKVVLSIIVIIFALYLITKGHRNIGPIGLLTQISGLGVLLLLLFSYNKPYSK